MKKYAGNIILTVVIIFFVVVTVIVNNENDELENKGITTTGLIKKMQLEKGGLKMYFEVEFSVKGKIYVINDYTTENIELYKDCIVKDDFKNSHCYNDEIRIKFLPSDPSINRIIYE